MSSCQLLQRSDAQPLCSAAPEPLVADYVGVCLLLLQTPSTSTCGGRPSDGADSQVDAASREQLQQLAQAMQQQLDLLANAVAELRQVRTFRIGHCACFL